ncbi:MAG: glycosyltransferase family A protein [Candidatus Colwellbacteria bacterium]|nr:glycosyltransferase family A protein [Candidatus Colwellbacteria bacterium]
MDHRFSIIVPAYNEEHYIGRCLDSLNKQDYKGFMEVIVVNNASTDKTHEIAEGYGVRVIDETKKGISYALIRGCKEARGDIFVFTDADTFLPPEWISEINRKFTDDPDLSAIGGPYLFYDVDVAVNFFVRKFVFRIYEKVASHILPCVNMAVRREIYDRAGGFNPDINWGQDIDLSKRLNNHGKVKFDREVTVITSFRRYSGGYEAKPMAMAHAVKELCVQLTRCYLVTKKGKVYSKTQKEIRAGDQKI